MSETNIKIALSRDEALVLFDWLTRFNQAEHPDLFEAQAEQRALWNLEAILDKSLVELLAPNYKELLDEARARLRDSDD
jgi:hypothetical protein